MEITGNQLRAARSLLGWQQQELADAADVGLATIERMEAWGAKPIEARESTLGKVIDALAAASVTFTGGESIGVKLAPKRRK